MSKQNWQHSHEIDFTAYSLKRNNPPAYELKFLDKFFQVEICDNRFEICDHACAARKRRTTNQENLTKIKVGPLNLI